MATYVIRHHINYYQKGYLIKSDVIITYCFRVHLQMYSFGVVYLYEKLPRLKCILRSILDKK